jgi:hypothetical protein
LLSHRRFYLPIGLEPSIDERHYRRFATAVVSFVSPSFECLKSAAVEGLGLTGLARTLVTPPSRVVHSRVVSELANYLSDSLANSGARH